MRPVTPVTPMPRAFHLPHVLLQDLGAFVDYDRMIAEAWEGTHVSRHTIAVTAGEVRRQLGEYGDEHASIR